jgi:hypothetical protein
MNLKDSNYTIRRGLLLAFMLWLALPGFAQQQEAPKRVLFVGNSFTYFFNLPQVVASMARTQEWQLTTRQSTVGGSNLEQHWKEERGTKTRALIESQEWDYVVFNNHSLSSIETPESFMEYGKKFAQLVKERGAKPVFMMTWAYKSNPLMQAEVERMYLKLGEETGADVVPAGPLFAKARTLRPDMELFFDDKHPSSNGTYLLGLAFYKYFSGAALGDIPKRLTTKDEDGEKLYLIFMHQEDADFLQQLVAEHDFHTEDLFINAYKK